MKALIEETPAKTGLRVTVNIFDKVYETGRKAVEHLRSALNIIADTILPQWNYTVPPQLGSQFPQVIF